MIGSIVLELVDVARSIIWRRVVQLPDVPVRTDVLTFGRGDDELILRVAGRTWDLAAVSADEPIVVVVVHLTRLRPESWDDVDPLLDRHLGRVSESTPDEPPTPTPSDH